MKRRLFLAGAVIFALASCTKDPSAPNAGGENSESTSTGAFTFLNVDQSRIVTSTGAATRAEAVGDDVVEIEALPEYSHATEWSDVQDQNQFGNGGAYKITDKTSQTEFSLNSTNAPIHIYVVKTGNIKLNLPWGNQNGKINVYIYPGAVVDLGTGFYSHWNIKCWGEIKTYSGMTMYNPVTFYYYGNETLNLDNFTVNSNTDENEFKSFGDVKFTGTTKIGGGTFDFIGKVDFDANGQIELNSQPVNMTFGDCAHINSKLIFSGSNKHVFNTKYFMYWAGFSAQNPGATFEVNLNNSVFVIDGDCTTGYSDSGDNVLENNMIIKATGKNSAVSILGSIKVNNNNVNEEDKSKLYNFQVTDDDSQIAILGKPKGNKEFENPKIDVWYNGGNGHNEYKDGFYAADANPFAYSSVQVNHPGVVIVPNSGEAQDCCYNYAYGEPEISNDGDDTDDDDEPGAWILPPTGEHKYSATGISFNGDLVYVSWHSNLQKDGEADHEHGTNGDYGYPSVEDEDDWGGIIDVISVSKYSAGQGTTLFEQTAHHDDFKYNHVLYNGGKLYLPATSWKVGAALNVIDLAADGTLPESNIAAASKRVNLTGGSANCVEIVGNNVWTVSGHTYGAVNFFSTDILTAPADDEGDEEEGPKKNPLNQTENYVEIASLGTPLIGTQKVKYQSGTVEEEYTKGYENFGGKYVVLYNNEIYVLRNTKSAVVSKFSLDGKYTEDIKLGVSLKPNDGKNVMLIDNGTIYVCCGQNGFYAFNMKGERVGGSMKHANGCDFDENYIYLATGDGLAILDKHELVDATREVIGEDGKKTVEPVEGVGQVYKTVKSVHYTGKGFNYPGTKTPKVEDDGEVKESSNFVKVHNGKIYVAYGMYGLRIYDPELIPGKAE